jgi:hypothetical protein
MSFFQTLLAIHITAGIISFLVAPIALIVKKGGAAHRKWGKIFFWSMTVVAITAIIMAPMKNNLFLTLVAVFSFYLAFSGYRALYRKNAYKTGKTAFIDWFFAILNLIFSLTLLIVGIINLPKAFGIISIVFGFLGCLMGIQNIVSFIKPSSDKTKWFFSHMTGMIAAYIASVSAFSAVNLNFDWMPTAIQWLWPTIIGVPLMMRWVKSYSRKFKKGKKVSELVLTSEPS